MPLLAMLWIMDLKQTFSHFAGQLCTGQCRRYLWSAGRVLDCCGVVSLFVVLLSSHVWGYRIMQFLGCRMLAVVVFLHWVLGASSAA